ncbi:hypothetical protein HK102_004014 [Quaeritorhiza haematococci]|nr:hypothetical protein HK102_004014 [Quaeritorhiza haematococci]
MNQSATSKSFIARTAVPVGSNGAATDSGVAVIEVEAADDEARTFPEDLESEVIDCEDEDHDEDDYDDDYELGIDGDLEDETDPYEGIGCDGCEGGEEGDEFGDPSSENILLSDTDGPDPFTIGLERFSAVTTSITVPAVHQYQPLLFLNFDVPITSTSSPVVEKAPITASSGIIDDSASVLMTVAPITQAVLTNRTNTLPSNTQMRPMSAPPMPVNSIPVPSTLSGASPLVSAPATASTASTTIPVLMPATLAILVCSTYGTISPALPRLCKRKRDAPSSPSSSSVNDPDVGKSTDSSNCCYRRNGCNKCNGFEGNGTQSGGFVGGVGGSAG